jgi:hypothetical protein
MSGCLLEYENLFTIKVFMDRTPVVMVPAKKLKNAYRLISSFTIQSGL